MISHCLAYCLLSLNYLRFLLSPRGAPESVGEPSVQRLRRFRPLRFSNAETCGRTISARFGLDVLERTVVGFHKRYAIPARHPLIGAKRLLYTDNASSFAFTDIQTNLQSFYQSRDRRNARDAFLDSSGKLKSMPGMTVCPPWEVRTKRGQSRIHWRTSPGLVSSNEARVSKSILLRPPSVPVIRGMRPDWSNLLNLLATPEGLEPPTSALGKPCSIRLS